MAETLCTACIVAILLQGYSLVHIQYLPKEELYCPPLNIRILDKRTFGRLPMVGTNIVKSLKDFIVEPIMSAEQKAALRGA